MKRFLKRTRIIFCVLFILCETFCASTVCGAAAQGSQAPAFVRERKAGRIKLKKYDCKGTTLYADTKLTKKRAMLVQGWVKRLPKKVRKRCKKIYFVRKKYYLMTGTGLKDSYGYTIFPAREIWLYNMSDADELRDTLYHEFGHCWDYRNGKFALSSKTEWETVLVNYFAEVSEPEEYYAMSFAAYFDLISDPDMAYIHKTLGYK